MKCPNCGAQGDGAFCSQCGAPLKGAKCRECQAPLAAGARFCNNCGAAVAGRKAAAGDTGKLPWIVAGASLVVLIIALAWPALQRSDAPPADGRVPISQLPIESGATESGAPPRLSNDPRGNADQLFNRIMMERERGDTAKARSFLPMALQAYGMAEPLDADGYYHLSLLHHLGGDYQAAQSSAQKVLATSPNHLLGLAAAAQAARGTGDNTTARRYYQQFLNVYDVESKSPRREYQDHANMLPELKAEAEAFTSRSANR